MIDGTYRIEVSTPLGRKPGTVSLRTNGSTVMASIDAPLVGKQRAEGRVEGNRISAEGAFKVKLMGKVSYALEGEVVGDELRISIASSKGTFEITGIRE